ncbi:MAG: helical backbone metal receptor, partial [Thermoanaerobaculia bacterium]
VATLAAVGCGPVDPARAPAPFPTSGAGEPAPERILTLAPNLTEIAFALGLGDRVAGVSEYASWPAEARELPSLGGLFDPNLERAVALEADLAILLPSQDRVARHLERAGVDTLTVELETLDDLEAGIVAIGERCGAAAAGRALVARLRRELAPRPVQGAPETMISVDRPPGRTEGVVVAGPGTHFHELLGRLGAENAFADAPGRYPEIGLEEVLARSPGAVLELRPEPLPEAARERLLADWRRFPELRGGARVIAGDWAMVLGPRLPTLYRAMERALRELARP